MIVVVGYLNYVYFSANILSIVSTFIDIYILVLYKFTYLLVCYGVIKFCSKIWRNLFSIYRENT